MTKYRLKFDCPHGKAGSVWEEADTNSQPLIELAKKLSGFNMKSLSEEKSNIVWAFPIENFSDWFEIIGEIPKFTKEQNQAIKHTLNHYAGATKWLKMENWDRPMFEGWLDANTES